MLKKRRGQYAIDFLWKYGWILLAAIIVFGTVFSLNLIDIGTLMPGRCVLGAGINCKDYLIEESAVKLRLQNDRQDTVHITGAVFTGDGIEECTWSGEVEIKPGKLGTIITDKCLVKGTGKKKANVSLRYYSEVSGSDFMHDLTGVVIAKVQA